MLRPHLLIDRANPRPIAQPKGLGEAGAVVGVDRGSFAGAGDGDIGGGGIDCVGSERFEVGDEAGRGCALAAVYGADPTGSDAAIYTPSYATTLVNAYDEYGIPNGTNTGRFGYTGQAWLPELGMWYYKARIYSPTLGRFLQTDPIGYKDQINLYEYVGDDPVNANDPTGLASTIGGCTRSVGCTGTASPGSLGIGTTLGIGETVRAAPQGQSSTPGNQNGGTVFINDQNGSHKTNRIGALAECAVHQGGCSRTVEGTPDGKVLYRAGSFKVRDVDAPVDPRTGMLLPGVGVSVNTNPNALKGMHTFAIPPDGIGNSP